MKIRLSFKKQNQAGALIVTLLICSVLAFSVMGYLSVIEQQDSLGRRSQFWNYSMTVAEAGIEEGLEQLNVNYANLGVDGWTLIGGGYVRTNTFSDGSMYVVSITNGSQPTILSQSLVKARNLAAQNSSAPFFAAIGISSSSGLVSRAVQVRCYRGGLYTKAMAARNTIDLKGNGVLTDSFDSEDPTRSNHGLYDSTRAGDNGDVASNDTIASSISVQNANIYGHAATGPGGTVTVGSQGAVGSHAWQSGNDGFEPGWVSADSNFTFPDTTVPYTSGLTPASGNVAESVITISSNSASSTTYPGSIWGGVSTNIVSTTTVNAYPNPVPPGMVTNTASVTSSFYPSPVPASVTTNITGYATSSTYPSPVPSSVTTNVIVGSSGSLPSPIPSGMVTNTTHVSGSHSYPAAGTYVGNVVAENGNKYGYDEITGYSWNTYTYKYPNAFSYTYIATTYSYPNYSYAFNTYTTNTVWQTNHYDNILNVPDGNYYVSQLTGKTIVQAKVNLVVGGALSMSGNDLIKVTPNGSITTWVQGTSLTISGNGVVNQSGFAKNFIVLAALSVTSFTLNGNGTFTGILVAPNADVAMNGGGNSNTDFVGSLMVNSVRMNGHFSFHYDEALGETPFWRTIPDIVMGRDSGQHRSLALRERVMRIHFDA